jgi:hypothetical protein
LLLSALHGKGRGHSRGGQCAHFSCASVEQRDSARIERGTCGTDVVNEHHHQSLHVRPPRDGKGGLDIFVPLDGGEIRLRRGVANPAQGHCHRRAEMAGQFLRLVEAACAMTGAVQWNGHAGIGALENISAMRLHQGGQRTGQ